MSVMKKVNRGWLLTISHNTKSRELYMRLSGGILKQTEERTFSYSVSLNCGILWEALRRPEIQLSGKQLEKLMKERSIEGCSIWLHHYRLQVRQSSCPCWWEAGIFMQEEFHSIISVFLFFQHLLLYRVRENGWMDLWAEFLSAFLCHFVFKGLLIWVCVGLQ